MNAAIRFGSLHGCWFGRMGSRCKYSWDVLDDATLCRVSSFLSWEMRSEKEVKEMLQSEFPFQRVWYKGLVRRQVWTSVFKLHTFSNVREVSFLETCPIDDLLPVLTELSRAPCSGTCRHVSASLYINQSQLELLRSCLALFSKRFRLELELRFDPNFVRDFRGLGEVMRGSSASLKRLKCCRRWKLRTGKTSLRNNNSHLLLTALQDNNTLTVMTLDGCKVEPCYPCHTKLSTSLQSLHFLYSTFNSMGVDLLCGAVASSRSLRELTLANCTIAAEQSTLLLMAVRQNSSLSKVNLSDTKLGPAQGIAVGEILRENVTLRSLNLSKNSIGDMGARAIARGLKENDHLIELDLSRNCICYEGGKEIGAALEINRKLERLCLADNGISNAVDFGIALALNSVLQWLDLRWNGIDGLESKLNRLSITEERQVLWKTHTWKALESQGQCR